MSHQGFNKIKTVLTEYFTLTGYLVPQEDAEKSIREGVSFKGTNMFILLLAILVASFGLNTNSTAVIIGAMLISPLMGPIIGIGLGVGVQDFDLIKRAARNLFMAAVFSVIASTIYFMISPVHEGHSELLARTSPTIYDVLIAFFGGFAGIIGIGSSSKGNVIPGVAIATALMPPLCTAGYGLATLQMHYFFGAFYLFIINSIYIALATFVGVKLMKYKVVAYADNNRARRVRHVVYWIATLTMLPSIYLTFRMFKQSQYMNDVQTFVSTAMKFPSTQVLSYNVETDKGLRQLNITLIGRILPTDSLKLALGSRLAEFGLKGTQLNFIQGDNRLDALNSPALTSSMLKDIYTSSQAVINRQQEVIDSLRYINRTRIMTDTVSATIAPELRVLFPQIGRIAVGKPVFSTVSDAALDTVTVAMVSYRSAMSADAKTKLCKYLEARLGLQHVQLVDVGSDIRFKEATEAK